VQRFFDLCLGAAWQPFDADAQRQLEFGSGLCVEFVDVSLESLDEGLWHERFVDEPHDCKLIAAHARDEVRFAECARKNARHRADGVVALDVPKRVVDLFELVHIAEEDKDVGPLAPRQRDHAFREDVEPSPVVEAGQVVGEAYLFEFLAQPRGFGDVAQHRERHRLIVPVGGHRTDVEEHSVAVGVLDFDFFLGRDVFFDRELGADEITLILREQRMRRRIGVPNDVIGVVYEDCVLIGFQKLAVVPLQDDDVVEGFLELVVGDEELLIFLNGALVGRQQKIDHLYARRIDEVFLACKKHLDADFRAVVLTHLGVGEDVPDARNEGIFVIGLCGEVVCACFEGADHVGWVRERRDEHDGRVFILWIFADFSTQLEAVHFRHHHVADDEVGNVVLQRAERFHAVCCDIDVEALRLEHIPKAHGLGDAVFDQ